MLFGKRRKEITLVSSFWVRARSRGRLGWTAEAEGGNSRSEGAEEMGGPSEPARSTACVSECVSCGPACLLVVFARLGERGMGGGGREEVDAAETIREGEKAALE